MADSEPARRGRARALARRRELSAQTQPLANQLAGLSFEELAARATALLDDYERRRVEAGLPTWEEWIGDRIFRLPARNLNARKLGRR